MKKVLFLLFIGSLLVSCKPTLIKYSVDVNYTDYAYFNQKGIFVTEAPTVSFDYESMGSLSIIERAGVISIENTDSTGTKKTNISNDIYGHEEVTEETIYKPANTQNVIEYFCDETIRRGGNGVLKLQVKYLPPVITKQGISANEGIMVTGKVIKK